MDTSSIRDGVESGDINNCVGTRFYAADGELNNWKFILELNVKVTVSITTCQHHMYMLITSSTCNPAMCGTVSIMEPDRRIRRAQSTMYMGISPPFGEKRVPG